MNFFRFFLLFFLRGSLQKSLLVLLTVLVQRVPHLSSINTRELNKGRLYLDEEHVLRTSVSQLSIFFEATALARMLKSHQPPLRNSLIYIDGTEYRENVNL